MKSFRETEAVSLEHGLDDAERFEKWGKARWMLLDEVNQWVVALRWGNHRSLAGVEHLRRRRAVNVGRTTENGK
jgi:hypothetical protein